MGLFGPPDVEKLAAKGDVKGLVDALGYGKPEDARLRQSAADALVRIGTPAVETLIGGLRRGGDMGSLAAEALGRIGDPRAVEPLLAVVASGPVTGEAVVALGKLGDRRAVAALIPVLSNADAAMRRQAAEALGALADPRAVEALIAALGDGDSSVREASVRALGRLRDPAAVGPLLAALGSGREAEAVVAALGEIGDREAVPALIEALGSAALVDAAAQALGKMGDPRAVEPLAAALRGDAGSPGIITRALIGFGEAAVPAVIPALADPRTAVREKAADLLDALNWQPAADAAGAAYCVARQDWDKCVEIGPVAVEPLLAALSATDDEVRHGAARALVAIGSPAVQPLIAALAEAKPPALSAIVEALGSIGDPRAVRPLLELSARGHDDQTRRAVDSAIAAIGPDAAAGPLASALADEAREVREAAIDGLVAIGEAGRASLRGALGSSFPDVRSAAAEALAGSGEPDALELLAPLFEDSEWPVRCAAARAAARLSDPNAAPLLVAALDDENSSVQVAAGRAIVALSGCLPMEPLVAAVKCSDVEVRKSAADALSRMGWAPDKSASGAAYWIARRDWDSCMNIGAPAVGPLIDALKDPEKGIPEAAAHALGAIGDRRAAQPLIEAAMKNRGSSNKSRWMPMYAAAGRALARLNDPQALEGLLAALRDDSHDTRVAAAELLVAMYRSPDLDAAARNAILSERGRITQPWESVPANAGAPHEDNLGIGIDF